MAFQFANQFEGSTLSFQEIGMSISSAFPSVMIPFVHPNKVGIVKSVIEGLRIGKVSKVDSILREDSKGKHYQVFVHFEFWDERNPDSMRLRAKISNGETAKIEYEHPWFWTLVLNKAVSPQHVVQFNPPPRPCLSFPEPVQAFRPPPPPLAPMLPFHHHQQFAQPMYPVAPMLPLHQAPVLPPQRQMIPRTLRMRRIGHEEKRVPRKREIPPPQLVAYKNPPVKQDLNLEELCQKLEAVQIEQERQEEQEEDADEDTMSEVSELTTETTGERRSKKGYYNDTDAPKADIIVPNYGSPEEIAATVVRIKRSRASNKPKKSGK